VFPDIKAVLFDKDGTLAQSAPFLINLGFQRIQQLCEQSRLDRVQSAGLDTQYIQKTLAHAFGLSKTHLRPDGLLAVGTRYENEIAAAATLTSQGYAWAEALAIAQAAFEKADAFLFPKAIHTPLFPHTKRFLNQLQSYGISLGLLSADSSQNVSDFVQTYQLNNYFTFVMGIDQPPGKPHPSLIHAACEALEVAPKHMLVIGDSSADIQLAHQGDTAGCIAMAWESTNRRDLEKAGAIAQSFDDIHLL
jgi:phosphoglycolate phosphatase